jgi:hypothetical protein
MMGRILVKGMRMRALAGISRFYWDQISVREKLQNVPVWKYMPLVMVQLDHSLSFTFKHRWSHCVGALGMGRSWEMVIVIWSRGA